MHHNVPEEIGVLRFIAKFKSAETLFRFGCCYWFAMILSVEFGGEVMYDQVVNHFGARIDGRVYDVTGDVTKKYEWTPWNEFDDEFERARIERDCVHFEPADDTYL